MNMKQTKLFYTHEDLEDVGNIHFLWGMIAGGICVGCLVILIIGLGLYFDL